MTIRLLNSDCLLLSAALSAALLAGCSRMNASTDNNEPVRPGQTSADTVVAHTFFPEHRKPLDAAGRSLKVPQGFSVDVFATGIMGARMLAVADDGVVYVTRPDSGEVAMVASGRDSSDAGCGRHAGRSWHRASRPAGLSRDH